MTSYQTFLQKLRGGLSRYLGEGYRVEIREVRKNNGVVCSGLMILCGDSNVFPTIYMEELFQSYVDGVPLSHIMHNVLCLYERCRIRENFDTEIFRDFKRIRERIAYRLVGYEKNREQLPEIPHMRYLDMALVCYISFPMEGPGSAAALVRQDMCRLWGIGEEELFACAGENTPRLFPACIRDMRQVLKKRTESSYEKEESAYMYLLTNKKGQYGAVCMVYPQLLQKVAQRLEHNFFILPGSVHETILVPERRGVKGSDFGAIVREINRTQVDPEEVLTDSVYYYDRKKEKILILDNSC